MAVGLMCLHTGLAIPNCSCRACTRRLIDEMDRAAAAKPGPARTEPAPPRRISPEWAEALRHQRAPGH
jgi:hypothetical protein